MLASISMLENISRSLSFIGGMLKSDDLLNFSPLPNIESEDFAFLDSQNDYLSGEHDRVLKSFRQTNEFLENTNVNEIIKRGNQRPNLREIHRVSYLVMRITEEGVIVPKNAFDIDYADRLASCRNFKVPDSAPTEFSAFVQFRRPNKEEVDEYLGKLTSIKRTRGHSQCSTKSESKGKRLRDPEGRIFANFHNQKQPLARFGELFPL